MHYRERPRRMGGLSLQWELICCLCRRKAVSDCVLSVAHVQRIAHWFFTLPTGVPMNHCVCVCYMQGAFGFCLNQDTPFKQPHAQSFTHSYMDPVVLRHIPWSFNQFDCYYQWLNGLKPKPIKRLSIVLTNPQDTPRPPLPFLLLNAPVIATISHSTSLVRWLSPGPVAL